MQFLNVILEWAACACRDTPVATPLIAYNRACLRYTKPNPHLTVVTLLLLLVATFKKAGDHDVDFQPEHGCDEADILGVLLALDEPKCSGGLPRRHKNCGVKLGKAPLKGKPE